MAVRKNDGGPIFRSPVRFELARLVSFLLYGTRAMLVLNFPAFENKKNTQPMTGPYGGMLTMQERINQNARIYLAIQ